MPRTPRHTPGGYVYHVLNRSAGRTALFRTARDYAAFERVILAAHQQHPLPLLAWCLMPNHWHFVVHPADGDDHAVTDFFRALAHTHAMRLRVARHTVGWGHVYQGRFKSLPVQGDGSFLRVCRYVERNALTAGLVQRAEDWRWGSLHIRRAGPDDLRALLAPWPVEAPRNYLAAVNAAWRPRELERLRHAVLRNQPYGEPAWVHHTARALDLQHTLRPEGRPRSATTGPPAEKN